MASVPVAWRGFRSGAAAGAWLALLDGALVRVGYASTGERLAVWGAESAILVFAGALAGLLAGLALDGRRARAAALVAASAPGWATAAVLLAPAWLPRALGIGAALAACGGLVLATARLLLALFARARRDPASARAVAAGALAASLALLLLCGFTLHRRYPGLHALELGGSFAAAALAAEVLLPAARARRGLRALALLGAAALLPASLALQASSQNVRFVVRQQTIGASQLLAASALLPSSPPPSPALAPARAPRVPLPVSGDAHLVLITVDALRPDHTGPWGYRRRVNGEPLTPTLDALAARGVRFERAYAQAPHSAYSISSLLASDYVASTVQLGAPLPPTLADHLGARAFHTEAWFPLGLFFNGRRELSAYAERRFGFARATTWDLDARALTDEVLGRIAALRREGEPRSFLWIHYFDVHEPYLRHPELDLGERPIDRYDSEIAYFDRQLARLLAALAQLDRPTVIALTADHGEEFKEHGGWYHGSTLYEEQVRVPLLVVAPGLAPRVVDDPVELVDLAPMLSSLLGEPPAPTMRGDDLSPLLVGGAAPERAAFSELDGKRMVARRGWKLIHDVRRDTFELYDLANDPGELANVYDAHPEVAARLTGELNGWIESLREPPPVGVAAEPLALTRARLGDKRVVPELASLIADRARPSSQRAQAARLAGALEGYAAKAALRGALPAGTMERPFLAPLPDGTPCDEACAEAALALGELTDKRAIPTLVVLLDDARHRKRAAVMLARLRDPRAMPPLLEVIADPDLDLRRRAIHYLGFVGDGRAIAPLEGRLDDLRARYLVALALARIAARVGDPRVVGEVGARLAERLAREPYEDNRAHFVCALGLLGAPSGIAPSLRAATADPPVKWATETLVRLGAIGGAVSGLDFAPGARGLDGIGGCRRGGGESTDDYAAATTCTLDGDDGMARFEVASSRPPSAGGVLALRLAPRVPGASLAATLNGRPLSVQILAPGFTEVRWPVAAGDLRAGENRLTIHLPGGGALDHLLLLPRPDAIGNTLPHR